jgi:hypothetical protein
MKKILVTLVFAVIASGAIFAQNIIQPNKPYVYLNPQPGYVTINELTAGIGMSNTTYPYAKSFFGFTTIHGYQIDKTFIIGGGTGVSVYNGGTLIPLFLDFRYRFLIKTITPYVFGDGGLLLNFSDFNNGTRLFINPGIGASYTITSALAVNLGVGLFMQMGEDKRDSFINFKLGLTFKPKN